MYGYLVYPVDFDAAKKYPVAFLIHGGPQGSFGNDFHYRWNPQAYAGAGYAAVMIDFHGSTGYGQAFTDAINGDWGGAPYEDLMKGLDSALAQVPVPRRPTASAALGASYGGYMINWIAGQTDRFKALVCHDGNLDERMAYFDTEELWFPEWEHGGTPWDNPEPGTPSTTRSTSSKNWKTPMLVIHGAEDFRVVYTQGLSTFTALQRKGDSVEAVDLPGREPLGAQAGELDPVARDGARLARRVAEIGTGHEARGARQAGEQKLHGAGSDERAGEHSSSVPGGRLRLRRAMKTRSQGARGASRALAPRRLQDSISMPIGPAPGKLRCLAPRTAQTVRPLRSGQVSRSGAPRSMCLRSWRAGLGLLSAACCLSPILNGGGRRGSGRATSRRASPPSPRRARRRS